MSSTPSPKSESKLVHAPQGAAGGSVVNERAAATGGDLVKESLLYKEFLAEREEILRHKWIESEKAGHDIGFEKALLDWIVRYRSSWRQQRQMGLSFSKAS